MLQTGRSRDCVTMRWIFSNLPNPSDRTMAQGSAQPLTEVSTRHLKEEIRGLTTLPPSVNRLLASTPRNPKGLHGL
jgi:hypothetical protein